MDTDIRLLLAIQYVCNMAGIKIPWKEAAKVMGDKFTEGAIVQHLSKLRSKRQEQDKPNPPPLKRANGNHKGDASKNKDDSPKEDSASSTRGGKRRRRDQSDDSEDDVYTLKKKQFSKNKKKDKVFAAPKLREKREETESDDSQKLVCVGAEWLRDFAGNDREGDDESAISEETDSSTESSEATTQAAKKSKIVTLKVGSERLASVDPYLATSATSRQPVTPTNPARAITNMPPRRQFYYPNMDVGSSTPFSTGVSIPFPSNGPSPFDIANRFPSGIPEAGPGAAPSSVSGGVSTFDGVNHMAPYSQFDVAPELQFADEYTGQLMVPVSSYFEANGFDNQFISDSEMFANLPDVEPPRYFGYEGEDTKEF